MDTKRKKKTDHGFLFAFLFSFFMPYTPITNNKSLVELQNIGHAFEFYNAQMKLNQTHTHTHTTNTKYYNNQNHQFTFKQ